jgi:nitrite reductase (NO-forming)
MLRRPVVTVRLALFAASAALLSGLILAIACTGGPARGGSGAKAPVEAPIAPDGSQQVTLRVDDNVRFDPPAILVKAGQPVKLTLENRGGSAHDFTLTAGGSQPVKVVASGGQSATGTFTIDRPGTYEFVCSVPGHAMAGMRGTLTAQ